MNWIRENKFLAGFIAIMVIGAGVLGYLLYSAWGAYADITDQYNQAANQLHGLQTQVPYPDQANLNKYRTERDDLVDATHSLATNLSQMVLPTEEMNQSGFQDRLRDTLSAVKAKADKNGVKLSDKPEAFTMDFAQYQTQPPAPAAAGPLGRQLAALQIVMNILIDEHVDAVTGISRTRLTQEGGPGGGGAAAGHSFGGGHPGSGGSAVGGGSGLVDKIPFEIRFTANQPAFQKVLNDLAASSKQFFITRALVLENTNPKPVSKSPDTAPAIPASGGPGAPLPSAAPGVPGSADAGSESRLKFLVGTEKLDVAMRIDMVAFNPPDKSARKGAAPSPSPTR